MRAGVVSESSRIHPRSVECPICGARNDMPSECLSDLWQAIDCDHCSAPIEYRGKAFGSHPREDYEVEARLNFALVADGLTGAQRAAILACPEWPGVARPARDFNASSPSLYALSDFWRGRRGIMPPISFTQYERMDFDGKRHWNLTALGRDLLPWLSPTSGNTPARWETPDESHAPEMMR